MKIKKPSGELTAFEKNQILEHKWNAGVYNVNVPLHIRDNIYASPSVLRHSYPVLMQETGDIAIHQHDGHSVGVTLVTHTDVARLITMIPIKDPEHSVITKFILVYEIKDMNIPGLNMDKRVQALFSIAETNIDSKTFEICNFKLSFAEADEWFDCPINNYRHTPLKECATYVDFTQTQ